MRIGLTTTVLLLSITLPCAAETLDEAANRLARAFFTAAASPDREVHARAAGELFSEAAIAKATRERLAGVFERIRTTFGAPELHHVEVLSADLGGGTRYVAHAFAKNTSGQWLDFQFRLDPGPPPRLQELAFVANVTEPVALPSGDIADASTLRWLDAYVTKLVEREGLSGAILIAAGDRVLYERYFGAADAKGATAVTADTRFSLGSGNKMMTALLAARLFEKGKLPFGASMRSLVPAFPRSPHADEVTVHHLLTHTSGIGEYWTTEYVANRDRIVTLKDFLPWIAKRGFDFAPGSSYGYSNSNFILAGLAIEKAGGVSYEKALRSQVFEPLGMSSSSLGIEKNGVFAEPLVRDGKGWKHSGLSGRGSSAGGAWSTPRDMLRFSRGLRAGKVVSSTMLDRMTTTKTSGLEDATPYGYGFILHRYGTVTAYGHGGTAPGVAFDFEYFPKEDLTFVIMSNQDNAAYDDLRKNALRLITGQR